MIRIKTLGHAVLRVRDLERSVHFYRDILGLQEVARSGRMAFFSAGEKHHDLAVMAIGSQAVNPPPDSVGLYHLAFKIGDSLEELRAAKQWLEGNGVALLGESDHTVSQSLYMGDPDGNEIELYVDTDPEIWHNDPKAITSMKPLVWAS